MSSITVTLESIEDAGPDRRARRLTFSDTSERLTAASVMRELDVDVGDQIVQEELEETLTRLESEHGRERALRLVGYRERSAAQLRKRLLDDGYPVDLASAIVGRFIELGLIDDERFARMYVRSRLRSGFGVRRVARELREKGVPDEIAQAALRECESIDSVEAARRVLAGRQPVSHQEKDRLVRRLVAKGYDMRTALEAVGSPEAEQGE